MSYTSRVLGDLALEMPVLVIVHQRGERGLLELVQHLRELFRLRLADGEMRP
jgi:hypothetical protein